MVDETVRLDGRVAGSGSGRKVLTLVASMLVGGCCIDDVERLRAGASQAVLPFGVVAPSTAGSFLRSFTFGHVRQLDKAAELALARAWSGGAAPDAGEMTVDLDSTVCEVCGRAKHGASYGHTKVLGYHPLVAVRSDTGEVLHSRMRSGSSQRGNVHFARETLARVRRLAAGAAVTVRADAGFFSYDMIAAVGAHGASYSITIPQNAQVKAAAAVAETTIEAGRPDAKPAKLRLVIRRSRLLGAQGELWPNWRYHCFVTDRHDLDTKAADANHRGHATVELAIRDLKEGSGLSRCPSGQFPANGAWLACCVLAHNLARWTWVSPRNPQGKRHDRQAAAHQQAHPGRARLRSAPWPTARTSTRSSSRPAASPDDPRSCSTRNVASSATATRRPAGLGRSHAAPRARSPRGCSRQ